MTRSLSRLPILRSVGIALLVAAFVPLCWPSAGGPRAAVTAEIARRLGTRPELVELEWFETRVSGSALAFDAVARVSESQSGDLHAQRYQATGTCVGGGDSSVGQVHLSRLPDAPPEPRP